MRTEQRRTDQDGRQVDRWGLLPARPAAKPFRDSIVEAGGFLVSDFRVPGPAIEEMLGAVSMST